MDLSERLPISVETFTSLLEGIGYRYYQAEPERGRVILDIQGEETVLRLHMVVGTTQNGDPWYARLISYSLDWEAKKAGVDREDLLEWLNEKNADVIFGRYYYDDESDTVAFEVSIPGNHGIAAEDLLDMLRVATVSVDKAHAELKALAVG